MLRSFHAIFELLLLLLLLVLRVVVVLLILKGTLMVILPFCVPDFHWSAIFEALLLLLLLVLIVVVVLLIPGTPMVILPFCAPDFHWSAHPLCFHRIQGLLTSLHLVMITLPPSPWPFSATFSTRHGHGRRAASVKARGEDGTVGGREGGRVEGGGAHIVHRMVRSSWMRRRRSGSCVGWKRSRNRRKLRS